MDITINVRISADERLLGVLEEVLHGSVHRAVGKVKEGIAKPAAPMAAPAVAPSPSDGSRNAAAPMAAPAVAPSPSDGSIPAAAPEAAPGAPERVRQVMAATRERLGATPGTPMYGVLNKLFLDIANSVGGVRPTALPADKVQAFEARCADIKVAPDGMPAEIPF